MRLSTLILLLCFIWIFFYILSNRRKTNTEYFSVKHDKHKHKQKQQKLKGGGGNNYYSEKAPEEEIGTDINVKINTTNDNPNKVNVLYIGSGYKETKKDPYNNFTGDNEEGRKKGEATMYLSDPQIDNLGVYRVQSPWFQSMVSDIKNYIFTEKITEKENDVRGNTSDLVGHVPIPKNFIHSYSYINQFFNEMMFNIFLTLEKKDNDDKVDRIFNVDTIVNNTSFNDFDLSKETDKKETIESHGKYTNYMYIVDDVLREILNQIGLSPQRFPDIVGYRDFIQYAQVVNNSDKRYNGYYILVRMYKKYVINPDVKYPLVYWNRYRDKNYERTVVIHVDKLTKGWKIKHLRYLGSGQLSYEIDDVPSDVDRRIMNLFYLTLSGQEDYRIMSNKKANVDYQKWVGNQQKTVNSFNRYIPYMFDKP